MVGVRLFRGPSLFARLPYVGLPRHALVDFDALPIEMDLRAGFAHMLISIVSMMAGALLTFGAFATYMQANSLNAASIYLSLGCLGLIFGSFGLWLARSAVGASRKITFTDHGVKNQWSWSKETFVPYGEYIAVRKCIVRLKDLLDQTASVYQMIELVHPDRRLSVPLRIAGRTDDVEAELHAYARKFKLPIRRLARDGDRMLEFKDIDTPFVDRIIAQKSHLRLSQVPPEISIDEQTDEEGNTVVNVRIRPGWRANWGWGAAMLVIAVFAYLVGVYSDAVIIVVLSVVTILALIWQLVVQFRKCERLSFVVGTLRWQDFTCTNANAVRNEWQVSLEDIQDVFLNARFDVVNGVTLITAKETVGFGISSSKAAQRWLKDFLVQYIVRRYVPDQDNADAKSSSEGANQ